MDTETEYRLQETMEVKIHSIIQEGKQEENVCAELLVI